MIHNPEHMTRSSINTIESQGTHSDESRDPSNASSRGIRGVRAQAVLGDARLASGSGDNTIRLWNPAQPDGIPGMLFVADAAITALVTHPASEPHHPMLRLLQGSHLHGTEGGQGPISETLPGTDGHP